MWMGCIEWYEFGGCKWRGCGMLSGSAGLRWLALNS